MSFTFTQEPCEGTCFSQEEVVNITNNIKELEFKEEIIDLVKPKWYDNKYLWFFGGIIITSGSVYLAGQIK